MNSVYTVHNSKNCFQSQQMRKKKSRKRELINVDAEPKRLLRENLLSTLNSIATPSSHINVDSMYATHMWSLFVGERRV